MRIVPLVSYLSCLPLALIVGIHISMPIDGLLHIPYLLLKELARNAPIQPRNLYSLLQAREVRDYGITQLFFEACSVWPVEKWEHIDYLVKDRPKLASILVSFNCLKWFDKERKRLNPDPGLQARYKFVSRLAPLPKTLDSKDEIALLIKNYKLVESIELNTWISANPLAKVIDAFCNSQIIMDSGLTHKFIVFSDILRDPSLKEKYFSMLKNINQPLDLFAHLILLKQLQRLIPRNRKFQSTIITSYAVYKAIKDIEERLPRLIQHYQAWSFEAFLSLLNSISRKEMKERQKVINCCLQTCDAFEFGLAIEFVALKTGVDCGHFLSKDNQAKLINNPNFSVSVWNSCFDKEARIEWFHRWQRRVPRTLSCRFVGLDGFWKFLKDNFQAIPPKINGISLLEFLNYQQRRLLEGATEQLALTKKGDCIHIDVKRYSSFIPPPRMAYETFYYILFSIIRQLYFRSLEVFENNLLDWIYTLARREGNQDEKMNDLKQWTGELYSFASCISRLHCFQLIAEYYGVFRSII